MRQCNAAMQSLSFSPERLLPRTVRADAGFARKAAAARHRTLKRRTAFYARLGATVLAVADDGRRRARISDESETARKRG
jgi:hypothetical protein